MEATKKAVNLFVIYIKRDFYYCGVCIPSHSISKRSIILVDTFNDMNYNIDYGCINPKYFIIDNWGCGVLRVESLFKEYKTGVDKWYKNGKYRGTIFF